MGGNKQSSDIIGLVIWPNNTILGGRKQNRLHKQEPKSSITFVVVSIIQNKIKLKDGLSQQYVLTYWNEEYGKEKEDDRKWFGLRNGKSGVFLTLMANNCERGRNEELSFHHFSSQTLIKVSSRDVEGGFNTTGEKVKAKKFSTLNDEKV